MNKWKKAVLTAVMAVVSLFCATEAEASEEATVYQGVFIEETDVSGMTEAEVRAAVDEMVEARKLDEITLHMNGHTYTTSAQSLGYEWSNEEVVQEALEYGKRGNVVSRYKQKKDLEQTSVALALTGTVDETAVQTVLEIHCTEFNQEAKPHGLAVEDGELVHVDGVMGISIDMAASVEQITAYMQEEWHGGDGDVDLAVTTTEPGGDKEALDLIQDELGAGSTVYSSSSSNRKTNVANAVSKIDGMILYPGESFSMLNTVLPFTIENGYKSAASYMQGEVVESIGGGVCQVSSTLYLALIRAELQIDERYAHSMLVSYVKPAFDAAVAEGSKDLKFTNNTDAPIYIHGTADGYSVAFTIYGMETRSADREIEFKSESISSSNPRVKKYAKLWKYVTEDGETEKVLINESVYYKNNNEVASEQAAAAVEAQIAAIGDVTLEDEAAIAAAEAAYNALSGSQQDMVGNASTLWNAKEALNQLKQEAEQPPAEQPPAEQPPAEQQPAEQPPAEQPPAEQQPAEQPPAEQPPAEQPPAEQAPAEQPPAE